jgi:hypothetical protein
VVDRQVVPQHVPDLAEVDAVPQLTGLQQMTSQRRHAGQGRALKTN